MSARLIKVVCVGYVILGVAYLSVDRQTTACEFGNNCIQDCHLHQNRGFYVPFEPTGWMCFKYGGGGRYRKDNTWFVAPASDPGENLVVQGPEIPVETWQQCCAKCAQKGVQNWQQIYDLVGYISYTGHSKNDCVPPGSNQ